MSDQKYRPFCGEAQFEGKKTFRFGTVFLPADTPYHEVEQELSKLWHETMPIEHPTFSIIPGMIFFVPTEETE